MFAICSALRHRGRGFSNLFHPLTQCEQTCSHPTTTEKICAAPILHCTLHPHLAEEGLDGPALVHCSAGIGRSGVLIVLDHAISQLEELGSVDIYDIVLKARRDRSGKFCRICDGVGAVATERSCVEGVMGIATPSTRGMHHVGKRVRRRPVSRFCGAPQLNCSVTDHVLPPPPPPPRSHGTDGVAVQVLL